MKLNRKTKTICAAFLACTLVAAPAFSGGGMGKGKRLQAGSPINLIQTLPVEELSADEKKGLLLMREEEKLARDVYMAL